MISTQSRTKEWIMGVREASPGKDPILIEKMIMALNLVENLMLGGLDFIFKGGTSLILLLGSPQRFSIDIDIILPDSPNLDDCFKDVLRQGIFTRFEESKRSGQLPKQHFKFYFQSVIQEKESHILLDILFEKNPYPKLYSVDIKSSLVSLDGQATKVVCPSKEGLLGDKLTAYAPHTTGIPYGKGKDLEIAKQLFDIAALFDVTEDISLVNTTFHNIASQELVYREMSNLSSSDVLWDSINTSMLIGTRGIGSTSEFDELVAGFKKMAGFVYSGFFSLDSAILCASKTAYLSALILEEVYQIDRFQKDMDISSWKITNHEYNKLNKLKKTSPEAFYYFYQALRLLNI
ncbi:MAG: hypothetical protein CL609_24380 [Anaerolineaceae bacterium]|jgi:hypothetical protein|nr:hypothetical protein [Anaerolineaceae bacterium]